LTQGNPTKSRAEVPLLQAESNSSNTLYQDTIVSCPYRIRFIPRTCIVSPFTDAATARRPDVVVLDETALVNEPLGEREPVITLGTSIKLVVEVVSTNWETDYARKVEEYALLGIPEYWIVDYRGLGGVAFIGRPKQPTITVCQLVDEDYVQQQYRLGEPIVSPMLPGLAFKLDNVLPR